MISDSVLPQPGRRTERDHCLRSFYQSSGGSEDQNAVMQTVLAAQDLYRRNVFSSMKVTWG
jgi:hypothetical protein